MTRLDTGVNSSKIMLLCTTFFDINLRITWSRPNSCKVVCSVGSSSAYIFSPIVHWYCSFPFSPPSNHSESINHCSKAPGWLADYDLHWDKSFLYSTGNIFNTLTSILWFLLFIGVVKVVFLFSFLLLICVVVLLV